MALYRRGCRCTGPVSCTDSNRLYAAAWQAKKDQEAGRTRQLPRVKGARIRPTETKFCVYCHAEFEKSPKDTYAQLATKKFCSRECMYLARRGQPGIKPVTRVKLSCLECGDMFEVKRHRAGTAKFCRPECMWLHRDEGKRTEDKRIRQSAAYRQWRTAVFERDDYTCQFCSKRGGKLNADHIKPFVYFPELRLDVDNGRTLCEPCHRTTETFGPHVRSLMRESAVA